MVSDFIYLRVRGHLERYKNPPVNWEQHVFDWTSTVITFLQDNHLLLQQAKAWTDDVADVEIRMSDLTDLGKEFIMSNQIEKWLQSYDKQRNKYESQIVNIDKAKLQKRFEKFLAAQKL